MEENIEKSISQVSNQEMDKFNWTKVWSKKYLVLGTYHYSKLDLMLVFKDILAQEWKNINGRLLCVEIRIIII